MGFFSYLFGTGEFRKQELSDTPYHITPQEITEIVSQRTVKSLSQGEEKTIEAMIVAGRYQEKISLRGIDMVLAALEKERRISKYDRRDVLAVFTQYFDKKMVDNK